MIQVSVLLVDDSPTFLHVAVRFLGAHEDVAVVGTVQRGAEALPRAQQLRPDVVLVDMGMPDVPGLVAIPQLRAALPSLGIIAVSLFDAPAYRQAALGAGADAFVPKAALSTDLIPAIRCLKRRPQAPPPAPTAPPFAAQPDGGCLSGLGDIDSGDAARVDGAGEAGNAANVDNAEGVCAVLPDGARPRPRPQRGRAREGAGASGSSDRTHADNAEDEREG